MDVFCSNYHTEYRECMVWLFRNLVISGALGARRIAKTVSLQVIELHQNLDNTEWLQHIFAHSYGNKHTFSSFFFLSQKISLIDPLVTQCSAS